MITNPASTSTGPMRGTMISSIISGEGVNAPEPVKHVESIGEAIKMLEELTPICDELERFVALPNDQFDAKYPAFKQKTKADHKLAGLLLPAIDKVREKEIRTQIRRAMLLTAIAVAEAQTA